MPISINCPQCRAPLKLPDTLDGKKVKCPKCNKEFIADVSSQSGEMAAVLGALPGQAASKGGSTGKMQKGLPPASSAPKIPLSGSAAGVVKPQSSAPGIQKPQPGSTPGVAKPQSSAPGIQKPQFGTAPGIQKPKFDTDHGSARPASSSPELRASGIRPKPAVEPNAAGTGKKPRTDSHINLEPDKGSKSGALIVIFGGLAVLLLCVLLPIGAGVMWMLTSAKSPEKDDAAKVTSPIHDTKEGDKDGKKEAAPKKEPEQPLAVSTIPAATLQALKDATVLVKAGTARSSVTGSGFLLKVEGETAYVVTSQQVVTAHGQEGANPPAPRGQPQPPRAAPRPPVPVAPLRPAPRRVLLKPNVSVVLGSGTPQERAVKADVVAEDTDSDVAVLKIAGVKNLPKAIDMAQRAHLNDAMSIYSLGHGKPTANKTPAVVVARGKVSGLRRDDRGEIILAQLDGDLAATNSGGPVVDFNGKLVGVGVAKNKAAFPASELEKLVAGHATALTVARKVVISNAVDTLGETWPIDNKHRALSVREHHQTAPDGMNAKPGDPQVAEVLVEGNLFDPMGRLTGVAIQYLKADAVKQPPAAGTRLEGLRVDLAVADRKARGLVKIPLQGKNDAYYFQLTYKNGQGQEVFTQARSFALDRGTTDVVTNPRNPKDPKPEPEPKPPPVLVSDRKKYTEAEITQLLDELKADDAGKKNAALEKLKGAEPIAKQRAEVSRACEALLDKKEDVFVRRNAAAVLGVWGDAMAVDILIEHFGSNEDDIFLKQTALESVGMLKAEKAIDPVIKSLGDFFLRGHAVKSLKLMGPIAEKKVLELLTNADVTIRAEACGILGQIGTRNSIAPLQNLAKDPNADVKKAAADALATIGSR
jgi:S1-C subfamily serine protease